MDTISSTRATEFPWRDQYGGPYQVPSQQPLSEAGLPGLVLPTRPERKRSRSPRKRHDIFDDHDVVIRPNERGTAGELNTPAPRTATNGWSNTRGHCSHGQSQVYFENRQTYHGRGRRERCLSGLWEGDPRREKSEADRSVFNASSRWILDSDAFESFLQDKSSRLLWIQTRSANDNLSGVIDELECRRVRGAAVAYSFCRSHDPYRAQTGANVLYGLIYLLVETYPFLVAWVWKEKPNLSENDSMASLIRILKRILAHQKLQNAFLVIENLGPSTTNWEQSLLNLICSCSSSVVFGAKWIISSQRRPKYEMIRRDPFRRTAWQDGEKQFDWMLKLDTESDSAGALEIGTLSWLRYLPQPPADSSNTSTIWAPRSPPSTDLLPPESSDPELQGEGEPEAKTAYMPIYEKLIPYDEFRTLTLWGGSEKDGIRCTIQRRCIHHPPNFEALSYEWKLSDGGNLPPRSITLNDENFSVGQNLWNALRYLRPQKGSRRVLWIDAICIQQNSDHDRNHQVAIMPLVYSAATSVISWVGTAMSDVVKSSMVFLGEMAVAGGTEIIEKSQEEDFSKTLGMLARLPRSEFSDQKMVAFKKRRREWQDLRSFFSLRYWKRLWIIQEVVLPRQLRIQCEDCSIEWPVAASFLGYLRYADTDTTPQYILDLGRSPAARTLYYRLDVQSSPERDFPHLRENLYRFSGSRSSDPRDRVYGLLGISSGDTAVQPDYSQSALRLYESMLEQLQPRMQDQLMSFSQLLQRSMGGLFHPLCTLRNVNSPRDDRQTPGTLHTRARICGNISLVGDAYTTAEGAKELLTNWHSLYFHHIRTHGPGDEIPTTVKQALLSIDKDVKKAVALDSRLSYAYVGGDTVQKPSWNRLLYRYAEEPFNPSGFDISDILDSVDIADCQGSAADDELCQCLRTLRLSLRPRWVIGTRGQIGLAAGTVREGDVICHFENSDVAVIVRPFADGWFHSIIGRILVIRQWDEEPTRIYDGSPDFFRFSVGTERKDFALFRENADQMSFCLDRTSLRLLSAFSSSDITQIPVCTTIPTAPMQDHFENS